MENYFLWYKSLHVVSVISWMAAILYMPRLFAYHTRTATGSETDQIFKIMEHRLLKIIMTPAMLLTYLSGGVIAYIYGLSALGGWFHYKMCAVAGLTVFHGFLAKWRKDFIRGSNKHSEKFYKIINEVPTLLIILAVSMVIIKPFE